MITVVTLIAIVYLIASLFLTSKTVRRAGHAIHKGISWQAHDYEEYCYLARNKWQDALAHVLLFGAQAWLIVWLVTTL